MTRSFGEAKSRNGQEVALPTARDPLGPRRRQHAGGRTQEPEGDRGTVGEASPLGVSGAVGANFCTDASCQALTKAILCDPLTPLTPLAPTTGHKLRAGEVLVVRWVDRLAEFMRMCATLREFMRRGVAVRTPSSKWTRLITFMSVTAHAQTEAAKATQRAGIAHCQGQRLVRAMLGQQTVGIAQIAKETGLTRQTVYRIKGDPAGAEGALVAWGM
jgi:putative DNA-invertase from lambdoid prophage Rac